MAEIDELCVCLELVLCRVVSSSCLCFSQGLGGVLLSINLYYSKISFFSPVDSNYNTKKRKREGVETTTAAVDKFGFD